MFEAGLNYIINNQINIFTNFSKSMQSQDIDRVLPYTWGVGYVSINPDIKPMQSRTINFGLNYIDQIQKFKLSTFYVDLDNEIVYNPSLSRNENIDRTNKYGYEVFLMRKLNDLIDTIIIFDEKKAKLIHINKNQ